MYNVNFFHTGDDNRKKGQKRIVEQFTNKVKARKFLIAKVIGYRGNVKWDGKDRVEIKFPTYAIALWIDEE